MYGLVAGGEIRSKNALRATDLEFVILRFLLTPKPQELLSWELIDHRVPRLR